jgi:predicted ATPase
MAVGFNGPRGGGLPADVTETVGRHEELDRVRLVLGGTRLLTLTGPGGIGTSHLALRAAARMRGRYEDGVRPAALSALRDAALLPHTLAAVLGLPEKAARTPADLLVEHLRDKRLLLVLDDCGHLADACGALRRPAARGARGERAGHQPPAARPSR